MSDSISVRALRGCCVSPGRYLAAGQVADVRALDAAILIAQLAVELLDERDAPKLRQALIDDTHRQVGRRLERQPGDQWQPLH